MFALSRAWQAVSRFFTSSPDAGAAVGRSDGVQGHSAALAALCAGTRNLYRRCLRVKGQWEQIRRANELAKREAERVRKEARRSERRALVLLVRQLNHEQRQEFRMYRHFHVTGGSSGNRYRIRPDATANIDVLLPGGKVKHRLCAGPVGVPVYALMAGQLLYLQDPASEPRFLQRANIHPTYPALSGNQV